MTLSVDAVVADPVRRIADAAVPDLRSILVGEDNPYGSDPRYALYPSPERSAGWRLCCLVMEMGRRQYVRQFDRRNLCAGPWSVREARATAASILREVGDQDRALVLLGAKVCDAFGVVFEPYRVLDRVAILPHPSGLNRMWNEQGAFDKARATLRAAGVL